MKTKNTKILVVDDDAHVQLSLQILLEQQFSVVKCVHKPALIPSILMEENYDVILLDMNFTPGFTDGTEGIQWLKKIQEIEPDQNVIMMTAYGDVNTAVEALKIGAIDFIVKPFQNEKLLATVNAAIKLSKTKKNLAHLKSQQQILSKNNFPYTEIIGKSRSMKSIFETIQKVAGTEANILILGENGTGKGIIAREIHAKSSRKNEVFIHVDLGAIPDTLFESELFGHVKGAFTDAKEDRIGRIEAASGGTLFLDEIGNLNTTLQRKLLSVIQHKQYTKVGSNRTMDVDIRLICATNKNIKEMVHSGEFREDLLYRINTVEISLPSLRDRKEDIPLLISHFLKIYKKKYDKSKLKVPEYVIKKLQKFSWPGNIRELQHAIERAVIMSDGNAIRSSEFNFMEKEQITEDILDDFNLEKMERWAIKNCLNKYKGNISKTAIELGLTRGALYRRLEKYKL